MIEVKIVSAAVIILVCTLMGRAMAQSAERRCKQLSAVIRAVRMLGIQVTGMLEPITQALAQTDFTPFGRIAAEMNANRTASDIWFELCSNRNDQDLNMLGDNEKGNIGIMLQRLGSSGRVSQEELLADCRVRLEESLGEARSRFQDVVKLYTSLGFLLGLYIVVLII